MDEGPGMEVEVPEEEGFETEEDVTIEEDDEGGATVIFGRDIESLDISSLGFGDNLAEVLDDAELSTISKDLCSSIEEDDAGR